MGRVTSVFLIGIYVKHFCWVPWDCSGEAYVPSGEIGGEEREREETVWNQKSYGRTMKMIRSGSKRATVVIEAQLREH